MIYAHDELLFGPRRKRQSKSNVLSRGKSAERYYSENPGKRSSGPINNPWDIGKYSKPLTDRDIENIKRTQLLISQEQEKLRNKKVDEDMKRTGYYSSYDPETKVLSYKVKPGQYTDPPLNPVKDFKEFDKSVTNRIKSDITDFVTDNITGPTKEFIEEKITEPVKSFFEGWEWYHWGLLAAGLFLILFLFTKGKQVVTQFVPWQ